MSRSFRLLVPGARALALLSLFALSGCSRAEKPMEAPASSSSAPAPSPTATLPPGVTPDATVIARETEGQPPTVETLIAAAPHPTEGTNNPDAVIHSPVPAPGATLHLLLPEGQNPAWLAAALATAANAKVEIKTYASDAEAVAAVSGEAAPDLASLSDRAAAELIGKNALRPLSAETLKGLTAPAPEFLHHYFDNKSVYTWPYGFTLLAIGTVAPADPKAFAPRTWRDLAKPDLALSLPADPALKGALWALAEAKPALSDTPPEPWQKAPYDAVPAPTAPGKVWVDTAAKLHAVHADRWTVTVPAEGSLITLYHWAIPAAASVQAAPAEAALRALADPATIARFDADANLVGTHAVPKTPPGVPGAPLPPSDPVLAPHEALLHSCRFVHVAMPAAEGAPAAVPAMPATPPAATVPAAVPAR